VKRSGQLLLVKNKGIFSPLFYIQFKHLHKIVSLCTRGRRSSTSRSS